MYPGIEPSRHNVIQTRLNDDLEGDVRILLGKFRQEPGYQEIPDRGAAERVEEASLLANTPRPLGLAA